MFLNLRFLLSGDSVASNPTSYFFFLLFMLMSALVFMGLGTWQVYRKGEKEALLRTLDTCQRMPPLKVDGSSNPPLFHPLLAKGHFLPGKTFFLLAKTHQGKVGRAVLNVFRTQGGAFLLVQRGWTQSEAVRIPSGEIILEGATRYPTPHSFFQPANAPPTYFWIDLPLLSREVGEILLPYYMVATKSTDPEILPLPPLPLQSNNHLQYAITWYGLACVVLSMLLYRHIFFLKRTKL